MDLDFQKIASLRWFVWSTRTQLVKNPPAMQFDSWVGKIRWRRERLPTPVSLGFPCGSAGKESISIAGDLGSIPGLGRSPGEGKGYHSCILAWVAKELDTTERPSLSLSLSSAFSISSLNTSKFLVQVLLKSSLENFEYFFVNVWDECNYAVLWTFFGIAFFWDWKENWAIYVSVCVCVFIYLL